MLKKIVILGMAFVFILFPIFAESDCYIDVGFQQGFHYSSKELFKSYFNSSSFSDGVQWYFDKHSGIALKAAMGMNYGYKMTGENRYVKPHPEKKISLYGDLGLGYSFKTDISDKLQFYSIIGPSYSLDIIPRYYGTITETNFGLFGYAGFRFSTNKIDYFAIGVDVEYNFTGLDNTEEDKLFKPISQIEVRPFIGYSVNVSKRNLIKTIKNKKLDTNKTIDSSHTDRVQ